jgi:protein-S-isoprenylcysteine O-methyltransferase Ste14
MTPSPDAHHALMRKFIRRTVFSLLVLGVVLFGAAGTLRWPGAWIYLALAAAMSFSGGFWLARHDPGLLNERLGSLIQRGQKGWDKLFMVPMLAIWLGWLVLMGLDAGRYHWSSVPLYAQLIGFVLLCLGCYIVWLTFKANTFAAPVIKIQKERGHRVVTTGPYAYVRHPMYAGALLYILGAPLLLGSWWGLAAAAGLFVLLGVRAVLEERTLKTELEGYAEYASRVRYRLVPRVW